MFCRRHHIDRNQSSKSLWTQIFLVNPFFSFSWRILVAAFSKRLYISVCSDLCSDLFARLSGVEYLYRPGRSSVLNHRYASADNRIQSGQSIASNRAHRKCRLCMQCARACSPAACIMIRNNQSKGSSLI